MVKKYRFDFFLFFLLSSVYLVYKFVFRDLVVQLLNGNAPEYFEKTIHVLYPRFFVEKSRFSSEFFLNKADQVLLRFALVIGVLILVRFWYQFSKKNQIKWKNYWQVKTSPANSHVLRVLFFGISMYWAWTFRENLLNAQSLVFFYKALSPLPYPNKSTIYIIWISFHVSSLLCIFNFKAVWTSVISGILFFLMFGFLISFGNINHQFASWGYGFMLMPFLLYETQKNKTQNQLPAWALRLIINCIAISYFFAGLEKLLVSDFQWFFNDTMRQYLLLFGNELGFAVANSGYCDLLSIGLMSFQLGFVVVLFEYRLRFVFMLMAIGFHVGVYFMTGIGHYASPWVLVFLFFINWERISQIKGLFKNKRSKFV